MKTLLMTGIRTIIAVVVILGFLIGEQQQTSAASSYQLWMPNSCLTTWDAQKNTFVYTQRCDPANYHKYASDGCYYHWDGTQWLYQGCFVAAIDGQQPFFAIRYTDGVTILGRSGVWYFVDLGTLGNQCASGNPDDLNCDGQISCEESNIAYDRTGTVYIGGACLPSTTGSNAPADPYSACMLLNDPNVEYDYDGKTGVNELNEYCKSRR
jgi:hypothetical protein